MKHSLPPRSRMLLRVWAGKVENCILPEDEALEVAKLLRLLADGKTVFEILGIQRVKNRPKSYMIEQRVRDVVILQRTRSEGGEGLDVGQAISKIAARKPVIAKQSLTTAYYGKHGKEIRASMQADLEQARALGSYGVWLGKGVIVEVPDL